MGAHKNKYPELNGVTAEELAYLLSKSRLSSEDREIAVQCLIWDMADVDIGAMVHMHRTTVGRHMKKDIVPQLVWLREIYSKASGF